MADWTAPFTLPKYTTEEFRQLKAAYVAEHGYTITFPGLFDVIKLGLETPMTAQEQLDWKAKRFDQFSENRLYDIQQMKQARKDKFLAMLASPAPDIITNIGSLMTAIDDAQDALFTLGAAGIVAMRFSPPPVAAVVALPTGIVLTAASALNVIQSIGKQKLPGKLSKRAWQKKSKIDPWSKKGRIKYAQHLLKTFPRQAAVLQGLQTTNEIFGIGLSLGPIVGLFIDIIAGPVRRILGDQVTVDYSIPTYDELTQLAHRYLRNVPIYTYHGLRTKDEEVISFMMATWLAHVALRAGTTDVPGWENFQNLDDIELKCRQPTNILTLEVIQEEGLQVDAVSNWPHNGRPWAAAIDIANEYSAPAQDFFEEYTSLHDKDWLGYIFKTLACDATFYCMANAEGPDQVEEDYTVASKACSILLENRRYPDPDQPAERTQLLAAYLEYWESARIDVTYRDLIEFCDRNDIALTIF